MCVRYVPAKSRESAAQAEGRRKARGRAIYRPVAPGQELCDVNGEKVGTIARVYREDVSPTEGASPVQDEVVEVKTGFMGLGQKLYVPVSAIAETTEAAVFVDKPADEFDGEWRRKPDSSRAPRLKRNTRKHPEAQAPGRFPCTLPLPRRERARERVSQSSSYLACANSSVQ